MIELDNPFWRFSLRVYAAPGVARECLELQDQGDVDVNVLLFACWLGAVPGIALGPDDARRIRAVAADWAEDVVRPLRAVRRRLKARPEIGEPEVAALRKSIAGAELASEQVEQALLYRLRDGVGRQTQAGEVTLRGNLIAILAAYGVDRDAYSLSRLRAACA